MQTTLLALIDLADTNLSRVAVVLLAWAAYGLLCSRFLRGIGRIRPYS